MKTKRDRRMRLMGVTGEALLPLVRAPLGTGSGGVGAYA
jgi:hypothetical protein